MHISKKDKNWCDVCANRTPCHVCGSSGKEGYTVDYTLFNAIYDKTVIKHITLKNDGQIVIRDITKADIPDLGWTCYITLGPIPKDHINFFGIDGNPIADLLPGCTRIERTRTTSTPQGISQIYVGWIDE